MKIKKAVSVFFLMLIPIISLSSRPFRAAVSPEPGSRTAEFFLHLSEISGVPIEPVPLPPGEIADALEEGIVDFAVLPESERNHHAGLMQMPLWGNPVVLIGEPEYRIDERNLQTLKTIGVFSEDRLFLERDVIDRFSLDVRIQEVRHYDILIRIMATKRVSAIFVPMRDFERSTEVLNEDRDKFGKPLPLGIKEDFLYISRESADKAAPSFDRIVKAVEDMRRGGLLDDLSLIPF